MWDWIDFDLPGAATELRTLLPRVVDLVSDITAAEVKCTSLNWTRAETAAHIIAGLEMYRRWVAGEDETGNDLDRLAASQVELIAQRVTERDPDALATRLAVAGAAFVDSLAGRDPYESIGLHGGRTQPVGAAAGNMIGELLLHGRDLAIDAKRPWLIDDAPCRHIVRAHYAVMPYFVDAAATARRPRVYEVRVGGLAPARLDFSASGLRIEPWQGGRATCHVALRPAAWPLVLYGRKSAISQVVAGKALAWGRNPFAAFVLRSYAHPEV